MLASSCPGWICYAEKTHGDFVLPFMSTTKSPQQVMGTLVKKLVAQRLGLTGDQVFHVTVMPCFDKKLEAARPELLSEGILCVLNCIFCPYSSTWLSHKRWRRDTDCVLTTVEVQDMIERDAAASAAGVRRYPRRQH